MTCATVQQDWGRLPLPSSAVVHQKGSKIVLQNVVVAKVRRADLPRNKKSSSFCCTTTNQSIKSYSHILLQHTSFLFTNTQSPCKKKSSDYDLAYVLYICSDAKSWSLCHHFCKMCATVKLMMSSCHKPAWIWRGDKMDTAVTAPVRSSHSFHSPPSS